MIGYPASVLLLTDPAAAGARDCRCDSSCMTAESGDGCHLRTFDPPPGRVACVRAARRIVLLLP